MSRRRSKLLEHAIEHATETKDEFGLGRDPAADPHGTSIFSKGDKNKPKMDIHSMVKKYGIERTMQLLKGKNE